MKSPQDSPAIKRRSRHYPPDWEGKVPLRIRITENVATLAVGNTFDVWVTRHGHTFAIVENGCMIQVFPNEYEILSFHGNGKQGGRQDNPSR